MVSLKPEENYTVTPGLRASPMGQKVGSENKRR